MDIRARARVRRLLRPQDGSKLRGRRDIIARVALSLRSRRLARILAPIEAVARPAPLRKRGGVDAKGERLALARVANQTHAERAQSRSLDVFERPG